MKIKPKIRGEYAEVHTHTQIYIKLQPIYYSENYHVYKEPYDDEEQNII